MAVQDHTETRVPMVGSVWQVHIYFPAGKLFSDVLSCILIRTCLSILIRSWIPSRSSQGLRVGVVTSRSALDSMTRRSGLDSL